MRCWLYPTGLWKDTFAFFVIGSDSPPQITLSKIYIFSRLFHYFVRIFKNTIWYYYPSIFTIIWDLVEILRVCPDKLSYWLECQCKNQKWFSVESFGTNTILMSIRDFFIQLSWIKSTLKFFAKFLRLFLYH